MNVMKKAWSISRDAVLIFGGKAKEYFAESLKLAWALYKQKNKGAVEMKNESVVYECSCCGTPLKNPCYFEGKIYGSTCIGYVSGAMPYISTMKQYGVRSVEEAKEIEAANRIKADKSRAEQEEKKNKRKAMGESNGSIYTMIVEHIEKLQKTGDASTYFVEWQWTLEEKSITYFTDKQKSALAKVYAQIKKANGTKGNYADIAWEYGVKNFGWVESSYDIALAKIKKMKFDELKGLAIKLNVAPEANECENNRSDVAYLRECLRDNLDKVVESL